MWESQRCLVVFAGVAVKDVSADGLAFWMADLTEVSVTQIHANAMNAFQVRNKELLPLEIDHFHEGLE